MQLPVIKLHKGREQSVLRKHPWIFSRAIHSPVKSLSDGDTVKVTDADGHILGIGHFQDSSLSVRMLAFEDTEINASFWQKRLADAEKYRSALNIYKQGFTEAFRLVHGEGDQLPGLIIDVYGHVAVVQAHTIGMHRARHDIAQALVNLKGMTITAVYSKSREALPSEYAPQTNDEWLTGRMDEELIVLEGGIQFIIDVVTGQKTGFFLDQRENRELVKHYSAGKDVLNCFSYTGGFSMYAMQGGATEVMSIDTSVKALEILDKNIAINNFQCPHQSMKENVLSFLTNNDRQFDMVIVDPPAFAKSLSKRHNAIQAYKRLNMMAMARIKKGGLLFTFSCSQVVDKPMFHNTIVAAAIESGRSARVAHELSQGPDHPVSIFHPEGQYLKGLALYMD